MISIEKRLLDCRLPSVFYYEKKKENDRGEKMKGLCILFRLAPNVVRSTLPALG